jgi:hypothetical protein
MNEPGDAQIPCPDQDHHDSRTCPTCQPLIRGPQPKPHAKIDKDKGEGK